MDVGVWCAEMVETGEDEMPPELDLRRSSSPGLRVGVVDAVLNSPDNDDDDDNEVEVETTFSMPTDDNDDSS